jgi:hypothetical protein
MCENLDEYSWTSHDQYRGKVDKGLAEPLILLKILSPDRQEAVKKYEKYMSEAPVKDKDGDIAGYFGRHAIGSEDFVRDIKLMFKEKDLSKEINNRTQLKRVFKKDQIISAVAKHYEIDAGKMKKKGVHNSRRPMIQYLLSRDCGMKNIEIAKEFVDLHHSVVGKNIARISALIEQKPAVKKEIIEIRKLYNAGEMGTER